MYDANIRKRKGTRTFLTSKKRRHLDRLNESDDLSQNLDTDNGKSNLDLCQLCKGLHSILQPCTCGNQVIPSTNQLSSHDNSL